MKKRFLAFFIAICMAVLFFVGCDQKVEQTPSSSNLISSNATKDDVENSSSSKPKPNSSTVTTSSLSPSVSRPERYDDDDEENEYGGSDKWGDWEIWDENGSNTLNTTTSQTVSAGIKDFNQRLNIGIYHMSTMWCDYYGTDSESREKEFREVVEAGYFNTYFLTGMLNQTELPQILREIEIIAENDGTFWLGFNLFHSADTTIEKFDKQKIAPVIEAITEAGHRDRLLGVTWDEPINIRGQANKDFLAQSELFYKKYGLRTFPVFAIDGFVGENGDINKFPGVQGQKIATEALKYVTDAGFDVYSVDVRDGAPNGGQYSSWTKKFGKTVTNGKEYYIALKELLKERVDHDVNVWYFPTSYEWNTWDGYAADEGFCLAQLEFMAQDIMEDEDGGGLALYTYYRHSSHKTVALGQHLDLKNPDGSYKLYPEYPKWLDYCKRLREITEKFNSTKANLVNLG